MRAGQLRHRVTIEEPSETQNEYGEPTTTWSKYVETWAGKEDLTGREAFQAAQVNAEITTRFRLRYVDGVNPKMRISHGEKVYDIESVRDPDGRGRELIILASRGGSPTPEDDAGTGLEISYG